MIRCNVFRVSNILTLKNPTSHQKIPFNLRICKVIDLTSLNNFLVESISIIIMNQKLFKFKVTSSNSFVISSSKLKCIFKIFIPTSNHYNFVVLSPNQDFQHLKFIRKTRSTISFKKNSKFHPQFVQNYQNSPKCIFCTFQILSWTSNKYIFVILR